MRAVWQEGRRPLQFRFQGEKPKGKDKRGRFSPLTEEEEVKESELEEA